MDFSFNSFVNFIANDDGKARIQRSTLWEKIKDTYTVIAGHRGFSLYRSAVWNNDRSNLIERPGVLDYLSLQINRMTCKLALWSLNHSPEDPLALMLVIPSVVAWAFTESCHFILSSLLTLLISPIVLIVHLYTEMSGAKALKNQAGQLKGKDPTLSADEPILLSDFMKSTGHTYNDMIVEFKRTKEGVINTLVIIENTHKTDCCITGSCVHQKGHIQFEVDCRGIDDSSKLSMQALIELNAGFLKQNAEEEGAQGIVNSIMTP